MRGKDFLTLGEFSPDDLRDVLHLSVRLKAGRSRGLGGALLRGKSVALVFERPSTRTRVSFQVGVEELGGNPVSLSAAELQLGRGETIEDTGMVLSRYVHAIAARVNRHEDLERLAKAASVPVVNGLSDLHHPVQILADLLTIQERKGPVKGLKIAWVGDGDNVCNSWAIGAALSGARLMIATPAGFEPSKNAIKEARSISELTGASVTLVRDPAEAARGADCVITDTFVSMGAEAEKEKRMKAFFPVYRVDRKLMSIAKKGAMFLHCLPAHRGEEVTGEVIDGPNSAVFDEAENRLHTEKALLCYLMLGRLRTSRSPKQLRV